MITMEDLLALLVRKGGSDLHISVHSPPRLRIDGVLVAVESAPLTAEDTRRLATSVLTSDQIAKLDRELELDCSFELEGQGRFRANVFFQRGAVALVLRLVPHEIATFEELGLPVQLCERVCGLRSGLVLVTGATGSGKSTSLAAMVDHVNRTRKGHIVTIEDPVEFAHTSRGCLVTQREIGSDSLEFKYALRSVLRQDPDVVLVGELRDLEAPPLLGAERDASSAKDLPKGGPSTDVERGLIGELPLIGVKLHARCHAEADEDPLRRPAQHRQHPDDEVVIRVRDRDREELPTNGHQELGATVVV